MTDAPRIEVLSVEEGQKYDSSTGQGAIASLGGFRGELVFLPALPESVRPDQHPGAMVRVAIEEVGKSDSRGRPLWRAKPAPDTMEEVWEADGETVRRVAIHRNWVFAEIRRETLEERAAATREGMNRDSVEYTLFLEATPVDSFVLESLTRVIPEEREMAEGGKLVWRKVSERREPVADSRQSVTSIVAKAGGWGTWYEARLEVHNMPSVPIILLVTYQKDGKEVKLEERSEWGKLPAWLQDQLVAPYPLCACGRKRHEVQTDGYGKCELCRAEETCERCGKQAKVTVVYGHLTCDACLSSAKLEMMIEALLTPHHLQRIAEEATRLRHAEAMEREAGETILGVTMDHFTGWNRNSLLREWSGYNQYYFGEKGVYGSMLAPAALALIECLPFAEGNGLVEMVAWFADGYHKTGVETCYYARSQVKGEQDVKPNFTEDQLRQVVAKLDADEPVLADWLRGSEADRQQALGELAKLQAEVGEHHHSLDCAKHTLQEERQDYALACRQLKKARQIVDGEKRLQSLLDRDYPVCPLCGGPWHDSRNDEVEQSYHGVTCSCPDAGKKGEEWQEFPVKQSFAPDGKVLVQATMAYGNFRFGYVEVEVRLDVLDPAIPDLKEVKTQQLMKASEAKRRQQAMEADNKLAEELRRCEGDSPSRVKVGFQTDPENEKQLFGDVELAGEITIEDQNGNEHAVSCARMVCDPARCAWLGEERPKAGEVWVCSLGKMIGTRKGRLVVMTNPQVRVPGEQADASPLPDMGDEIEADDLAAKLAAAWGAKK